MLGFPASDVRTLMAPIGGLIGRYHPRAIRRRRVCEVGLVLLGLVQDLQLHRGLSSALLDGQPGFRDERDAVERKLQRSLHALGDHYGERYPVFREAPWRLVLGRWESLRNNWRGLDADTNLAVHAELVGEIIGILRTLAAGNAGVLGEGRYLALRCWPALVEHLGMLRALGLRFLGGSTAQCADPSCTSLRARVQTARFSLGVVSTSFPDPGLVWRTGTALQGISELVDSGHAGGDAEIFHVQMTALIDDWYGVIGAALREN